ncbi:peptidase M4 [Thermoanaerobacterium thermosaccharolyticum]|uniref:Propeptide PepSY amd peptidase M4 n=1 Tax=Thermoanaerobacterium thermosaccharolyticum TaxID=1517 RepID=A0A223I1B2_THETR|nr:YcdB/YcdC domain-containing protein [Thermoanaerobacterium thermosaccharolyticum]AST58521.1 propeptide PepSY amd peptidase M4 [Thermoanaerobacterium thermosaccharolyticum]PHO08124.1 peptidase M4 [Thermoanaerobacterium thermosaccharolyticum]
MKKITAIILMFIILTGAFNVYAAQIDNIITKEKAISIVKDKLGDIKYDNLNVQYREFTNKDSVWILSYTKNDIFENTSITLNAKTGDIIRYNFISDYNGSKNLNRNDAKKIADEFLNKVKPTKLSKYKFDSAHENDTYREYNFKWRREENGVKFLYDTINVSVDKKTGYVTHYTYDWTEGDLPTLKNVIDINEATKLFKGYLRPRLVYTIIYDKNKGDVKLVYVSPSPQYMINAYTGDIIDINGTKVELKNTGEGNEGKITLDKFYNKSSKPVTKDEAYKIASKYASKDYELKNTAYIEKYAGLDLNVWTFAWNKVNGIGYLHVAVNANTGNVVDVLKSTKSDLSLSISRETALKKAESFIKDNFKDIVPYLDFRSNTENQTGEEVYGYHFVFPLKQYNIPFINNGITVDVDGKGNVSAYTYKNYDIPIPMPSNIMTQDEITDKYLKNGNFSLKYYKPEGKDIIPVYTVDDPIYSNLIDAISGEIIKPY